MTVIICQQGSFKQFRKKEGRIEENLHDRIGGKSRQANETDILYVHGREILLSRTILRLYANEREDTDNKYFSHKFITTK